MVIDVHYRTLDFEALFEDEFASSHVIRGSFLRVLMLN